MVPFAFRTSEDMPSRRAVSASVPEEEVHESLGAMIFLCKTLPSKRTYIVVCFFFFHMYSEASNNDFISFYRSIYIYSFHLLLSPRFVEHALLHLQNPSVAS